MHENILKKLGQKIDRRSFLRGSGLVAASVAGVAAFPLMSAAEDAAQQAPGSPAAKDAQDARKTDKPADHAEDDKKDDKADKKEEQKDAKDTTSQSDPFKETKKDENGRDYRMCPQCGYNMYKQDRTWTCENCGFSYSE